MEHIATRTVAELNDQARRSGFGLMITQGIQALGAEKTAKVVNMVRFYDLAHEFNRDNDPYGEHDFGSFIFEGQKVFWKIDYYDQALEYGSEPLDPGCKRVITIMLASEY